MDSVDISYQNIIFRQTILTIFYPLIAVFTYLKLDTRCHHPHAHPNYLHMYTLTAHMTHDEAPYAGEGTASRLSALFAVNSTFVL